jgi:hypothetical protein
MRSIRLVAALALLGVALAARPQSLAVSRRPSGIDLMLRDAIAGGLVGSTVAGGILGYNLGIQGRTGLDWGRTLAWGAGIGVAAGLVAGLLDAGRHRGPAQERLVRDGLSRSLNARARDQSHSHLFPLLSRSF